MCVVHACINLRLHFYSHLLTQSINPRIPGGGALRRAGRASLAERVARVLGSVAGSSVVAYEVALGYDDLPLDQVSCAALSCAALSDMRPWRRGFKSKSISSPGRCWCRASRCCGGCCRRTWRRPRRLRRWATSRTSTSGPRSVRPSAAPPPKRARLRSPPPLSKQTNPNIPPIPSTRCCRTRRWWRRRSWTRTRGCAPW